GEQRAVAPRRRRHLPDPRRGQGHGAGGRAGRAGAGDGGGRDAGGHVRAPVGGAAPHYREQRRTAGGGRGDGARAPSSAPRAPTVLGLAARARPASAGRPVSGHLIRHRLPSWWNNAWWCRGRGSAPAATPGTAAGNGTPGDGAPPRGPIT